MDNQLQYHDDLTGAYNRRYLNEQVVGELTTRITGQQPFCLVMIDIDRFKEINDTYGHTKGDEVIREFADFLAGSIRGSDLVIRHGGDEFLCVMNDAVKKDAFQVLNRIVAQCRERRFGDLPITMSAGLVSFPGDGDTYEEIFAGADQALYEAKRAGRDRVSMVGDKKAQIPIKLFVDRVQEKEAIRAFMVGGSHRLRVAVIHGLVGVGKTRLSREVLTGLKEREIIWSDCILFDKQLAYYVIRELIRYRFKRWGPDLIQSLAPFYLWEIGKLLPEILAKIKDNPAASEVMDRYRLYESVRQVLEMGTREKIIIIDNIQWIDSESVEVLKYVIRALQASPHTFIFIHRTEEMSGMLAEFLAFVSRDFETRDVLLQPFSAAGTKEAVRAILGEEPAADLVDFVFKESGGVPLYIEEVVRVLLDQQNLRIEEGRWNFTEPGEHILSGTVSDIALRKYRSLSAEARQVMDIAVIFGWFDLPLIRNITSFNEGHVMGLINEINRLGLIKYGSDRYEFNAAVSRYAIYKQYLEGPQGVELHRVVARQLESLHPDKENDYAEDLAFHYYAGREAVKGAAYCRIAGDKALKKYANRDAIRFYGWAAELLGSDPAQLRPRLEMLMKKAERLIFIGDTRPALDLIESVLKEARPTNDRDFEAEILRLLMDAYLNRAEYDKALEIGDRIFRRYEPGSVIPDKAKILNQIGRALFRMGRYEPSMAALDEALALCLASGDEATESKIRFNMGTLYNTLGDYAKNLVNLERCRAIITKFDDKNGVAMVLISMSIVHSRLGDIDRALSEVQQATDILRDIGNRINEAGGLNNLGGMYQKLGRYDEARVLYERALKIHRDIGNKHGIALISVNIGSIDLETDNTEQALRILDEAYQNAREVKSKDLMFLSQLYRAEVSLATRQLEKIEPLLDIIINDSKDTQYSTIAAFSFLNEYFLTIRDDARFQESITQLAEIAKSSSMPRVNALHHFYLGRYELDHGFCDAAVENLTRGLDIFRNLQDRKNIALSYYYLAKAERGCGNETAYRDHFVRAKQELTEIKAKHWLSFIAQEEGPGM